jgi:hypothetical protein
MFLPGNLRTTTLGDLLGQLHREAVSGILELIEERTVHAGRRHRVHLQRGLVARVETPCETPRVGELLVKAGTISAEQHRSLLERLRAGAARQAGAILLACGVIDERDLSKALAEQTRLRLDVLFRIEHASIRFHAGRPSADRSLQAADFLHGRPRARDRRAAAGSHPREPAAEPSSRALALAVLGLRDCATRDEVRHAFRRQALSSHPDLHPEADVAKRHRLQARFAELSAAYHTLIAL